LFFVSYFLFEAAAVYAVQMDFNKIRHEEGQVLPVFEYSELLEL
jgi:hypothetical protein